MKCYLVGGAVRDHLLGLPVQDRDWVVVGATPEEMLRRGYRAVGKDFPVFLHPESQEEYALARTEKKTGPGYSGFETYADSSVTLEDDLKRRDLTINAMAQTEDGTVIDPYHGQKDIEQRKLRHVSQAFTEDPVRVLRIARFASRYAHLGFTVHQETMSLLCHMVDNGEVDHLVAERVWAETQRALAEAQPTVYFEVLKECGALEKIFPEIFALYGIPQPEQWHPEIDTGLHTMMVLAQASILSDSARIRFAALVHDLGKATTPKEILPGHHGHEERSVGLIENMCKRLNVPNEYRDLALIVARYHGKCHRAFEMRASSLVKLLGDLDAFRRPQRLKDFVLCCEADARGRTGLEQDPYPQARFLKQAYQHAARASVDEFDHKNLAGHVIAAKLHQSRVHRVKSFLKQTRAN